MAVCKTCGAEVTRIRTLFERDGKPLAEPKDECPACAPQTFEKIKDPSDKKIWIGPEYAPNDYEKRYDSDGVYYRAKPEITAEREAKLFEASDEREKYNQALAKKRAERRTEPMTAAELRQALNFVNQTLRPLIEDEETAYDA